MHSIYFIPSRIYGVLDYLFGLVLISSPWAFGFADHSIATYIPVCLGAFLFVLALITNFEHGMIRMVPFSTHLAIDFISGLFLAASPWMFNFVTQVYAPHLVIGMTAVFIVAVTRREPYRMHLRSSLYERRI